MIRAVARLRVGLFLATAACAPGATSTPVVVVPAAPSAPPPATAAPAPTEVRAAFEVLDVDDAIDPFEAVDTRTLPAGVSLLEEVAPLGPEARATRRYARVVPVPREGLDDALARVRPWLAGVKLPRGDRFAMARVLEIDDDDGEREPVGWRTYVVRDPPILDASDVAACEAILDEGPPPMVSLAVTLTARGGERFAAATRARVRRRLALVVGGLVESAPLVMSEIQGGFVRVTLGTGPIEEQLEEARTLARRLGRAVRATPAVTPHP